MHFNTCNKLLEKLLDAQRKLEDVRQTALTEGMEELYLHISMALKATVRAQEVVRDSRTK